VLAEAERSRPLLRENPMRVAIAVLFTLIVASNPQPTRADPYRWCATYGKGFGGAENCYFMTIEQCRASVSGLGGFCRPNNFYDGKPVMTPEDAPVVRRRSRS
jgi:hypothetical protein